MTATAGAAAGQVSSAEIRRRQREMKAKHEQRAAEIRQRQLEIKTEQARYGTEIKAEVERGFTEANKLKQSINEWKATKKRSEQLAATFDPAAAPPPVACLAWYIAAARSARSMEELLKYLPVTEQQSLKADQADYDPRRVAESRATFKKWNPKIDEDTLTRLTNPPYVNALARHKKRAEGILDVLSVKIDGRKAVIEVSTTVGGTSNGVEYPYGTAEVELLGEEGFWKFDSYSDSAIKYMYPPQPKR